MNPKTATATTFTATPADNDFDCAEPRTPKNLRGKPLYKIDYDLLEERYIDRATADAALLRNVESDEGADIVGRRNTGDLGGIAIPYIWPGSSSVREYRLRPYGNSKSKYLSPPGAPNRLYIPPHTDAALLADITVPVLLCESEFKTLATARAAWHGLSDAAEKPRYLSVGIAGVWGWRGKTGTKPGPGGKPTTERGPIPDLQNLTMKNRPVVIVFDADAADNQRVQHARLELTGYLESRGAHVSWFCFPPETPASQNGIDDYLAANGPDDFLEKLAQAEKPTRASGWTANLLRSPSGKPRPVVANALLALRQAPEFKDALAYDEFNGKTIVWRPLPWPGPANKPWGDSDDVMLAEFLQNHSVDIAPGAVGGAVDTVAREHTVNPVRAFLTGLKWDGMQRLGSWPQTYLGVRPDSPAQAAYVSAVGRCWLVSAVARALRPGCQADYTLILEGQQGIRKSSALRILAGDDWFKDDLGEFGKKDTLIELRGKWIVEMAEVTALLRADPNAIKSFTTRRSDNYRCPYDRRADDYPRMCVFCGTTNNESYLKDETGNRRFWPLRCGEIDLKALERDREQIWAEATARYNAGEKWWFEDASIIETAADEQSDRYDSDPWQPIVDKMTSQNSPLSIEDVLEKIGKPSDKWDQRDKTRVARCLVTAGWEKRRLKDAVTGKRDYRYVPKTAASYLS